MLKSKIEHCSKLLTFNPWQSSTENQSIPEGIVAADTPIRAIKPSKKKILLTNRAGPSCEDRQCSVSSMLYREVRYANKENSRQSINDMQSSRCEENEAHGDSHFYLETSMCGNDSRFQRFSREATENELIVQTSLKEAAERYRKQARNAYSAAVLLEKSVLRHCFKVLVEAVAKTQSERDYCTRKLKRVVVAVRNLHTREPFTAIASIRKSEVDKLLSKLTAHFVRCAGRHVMQQLRRQQGISIEEDVRKISQFLQGKQEQLALAERRAATRLMCHALNSLASRRAKVCRFVEKLVDQLHTLGSDTSRFANSVVKRSPQASPIAIGVRGHFKGYSFSRIVQSDE